MKAIASISGVDRDTLTEELESFAKSYKEISKTMWDEDLCPRQERRGSQSEEEEEEEDENYLLDDEEEQMIIDNAQAMDEVQQMSADNQLIEGQRGEAKHRYLLVTK